ncbi:MAG: peptidoglycan editing factor PgeF [Clostridia bacterium]|nr:peptidoglycan editing factor PgeF [Clostridia bacterium]
MKQTNHKGVIYFKSEKIRVSHGFSTRLGGVSKEPHLAEMNLGKNLGDDPASVEENYRRMASAIGFENGSIVFTNQIHSNIVLTVGKADIGKVYDCDGFVTKEKGVTLAVRSADCVPILFYDDKARVIGAVHAGWRGTVDRIQQNCVRAMCELGATPEGITVLIGACIHKCCYKVGEDFCNTLYERLGRELTDRYVSPDMYADLVGLNRELLEEMGVRDITASPDCTCCKSDLYFSHRASKGKRGVMSAFISL